MNINSDIAILIDEIRDDRIHGASQLARQAVSVLKIATELSQSSSVTQFLQEQREVGDRLISARPSMAPIFNIISGLLDTMAEKAEETDLDAVKHFAISKFGEASKNSLRAVAQIAMYGSELITAGDRIMTHSYSSTVVEVLKEAFNKHGDIEVITTRSGPGRTGEKIAQELRLYGIPITFIDDAAVGLYIPIVNKVMVGADRVCADGKIVNGIGTYQLALATREMGNPFYVLCDMLKFDSRLGSEVVDLEEKEPFEVVEEWSLPLGVTIKNPHFDITPLELITGIVTENGLLMPEEVVHYLQDGQTTDS